MEDVIMLPLSDLLFNNTRNISADFAKSRFEKNVNITGFLNVGGAIFYPCISYIVIKYIYTWL